MDHFSVYIWIPRLKTPQPALPYLPSTQERVLCFDDCPHVAEQFVHGVQTVHKLSMGQIFVSESFRPAQFLIYKKSLRLISAVF